MGQACACFHNSDLRHNRNKDSIILSQLTPQSRQSKNKQFLISSLVEDFKEEQFTHLFSNKINLENFEIIKVIGRGTFAKVYLVKKYFDNNEDEKFFALKVIKKKQLYDKQQMHHTLQERQILMEVKHPFIVQLHYAFQSPDRIYFVLDYVNGGDLFYHLKKKTHFNEQNARFYITEIILAMHALHQQGFIYRDLKPENILLDNEGHVKLADFGLSKSLGNQAQDLTKTVCGTPHYLAPEIIQRKGYNKMADWWCLGILLYELIVGSPPFNDRSQKRVMNDIVNREFAPREYFSRNLKKLLFGLLEKNPSKRLGSPLYGGVESIKKHEFFTGIDWDKVLRKEYKPPIKPKVKNGADTKNIDRIFLKEQIKNTPAGSFHIDIFNKMQFDNFTFSETATYRSEKKEESNDNLYLNDHTIEQEKSYDDKKLDP